MLETLAMRSPIERLRIHALTNLCRSSGPKPVPAIVPLLKDKSPAVRILACEALAGCGESGVVGALLSVATEDELEVARVALTALSTLGGPGIAKLSELIRKPGAPGPKEHVRYAKFSGKRLPSTFEPQWDIPRRVEAIRAVGKFPASAAVLVEILADTQVDAVQAAVDALIQLGPVSIPLCVAALTGPVWARRHNAALTLSRMNWQPTNDAEKGHFLVLQDQIDQALKLGLPVSDALALALQDPNKMVGAALAFLRLQDKRGAEAFQQWLAHDVNGQERWADERTDVWLNVYRLMTGVTTEEADTLRVAIAQALKKKSREAALDTICAKLDVPTEFDVPMLQALLDHPKTKRGAMAALLRIDSVVPAAQAGLIHALLLLSKNTYPDAEELTLCRTVIKRITRFPNYATTAALSDFIQNSVNCVPEAFGALEGLDRERARRAVLDRLSSNEKRNYVADSTHAKTFLFLVGVAGRYDEPDVLDALQQTNKLGSLKLRLAATKGLLGLGAIEDLFPFVKDCIEQTHNEEATSVLSEILLSCPHKATGPFNCVLGEKVKACQKGCEAKVFRELERAALPHIDIISDDILSIIVKLAPVIMEKIMSEDHGEQVWYGDVTYLRAGSLPPWIQKATSELRRLAALELTRRIRGQ